MLVRYLNHDSVLCCTKPHMWNDTSKNLLVFWIEVKQSFTYNDPVRDISGDC